MIHSQLKNYKKQFDIEFQYNYYYYYLVDVHMTKITHPLISKYLDMTINITVEVNI